MTRCSGGNHPIASLSIFICIVSGKGDFPRTRTNSQVSDCWAIVEAIHLAGEGNVAHQLVLPKRYSSPEWLMLFVIIGERQTKRFREKVRNLSPYSGCRRCSSADHPPIDDWGVHRVFEAYAHVQCFLNHRFSTDGSWYHIIVGFTGRSQRCQFNGYN